MRRLIAKWIINSFPYVIHFYNLIREGGIFIGKRWNLFCGYLWETGTRERNEDSLAFWHMRSAKKEKVMAVICDGIGGLPQGEQASSYVVRQMANWFMSGGYRLSSKRRQNTVQSFLFQLHEEIREYGKDKGISLGTTATIVFMENYKLYWFHCGDCRLYLLRNRKVKQLTGEHQDRQGNLTRAIGVGSWNLLESGSLKLKKKDRILMCPDGLYRNLDKKELKLWSEKAVDSDEQAGRMLKQLFQKKMSLGEKDNLSALYFGYAKKEAKGE